jgi:hypothetical protein
MNRCGAVWQLLLNEVVIGRVRRDGVADRQGWKSVDWPGPAGRRLHGGSEGSSPKAL